ncbi:MAG: hypothetical protein A3G49_04630 [Candidatus Sungbacteria bacterium RIFCSPLOWO2_12_FULL_41_11]|uniref:Glycosyltransferase RgtA/B/C/D-like domain-containing protein n=1 Tax=Candidatus Sungbacteria bacterium RIFCSPLOWO2_12_FULL_41_11 TaxID=1802286 RepID=A0A1G2LNC0_9BACT|nr:MAG: 4-amino-4-deoxy-L-arabinose transferase [Parcubacteria group bacterium GW2011_GWA2_42_14]OGZ99564.1 MAG: hypothetical protein A3D41_01080 [Candidatus Sungbacteria bacterium RIFCSPHIGHO2_02_FULL_41_12b]OHA13117.1 MAG: hypothetical protein A3G49_04630 [Candidatus Sungbacteria bacterium RIFCSPLOWO2_12_FULL_41_11]
MKKANLIAILILSFQFILMLASSWNDSAIMDELAHIPAAYSYVSKMDYRLNPEHPPLIKDLSALPLLFFRPNFPTDVKSWTRDNNGQWTQGAIFLYESGNNPDKIIFWSRLPIMLLSVFMGWLIFSFIKKRYNDKIALMTLVLFAFSPTFLAHSRFVTTDLAAAFGFFIGIIGLIMFLEKPTLKMTMIAGIFFGVAQLLKFSLILLIPIFLIIILIWFFVEKSYYRGIIKFPFFIIQILGKTVLIFAVGGVVIYGVYAIHVINYPASSIEPDGRIWTKKELTEVVRLPEPQRTEKIATVPLSQMRDTVYILSSFAGGPDPEEFACDPKSNADLKRRIRCLAEFTIWATDKPLFRPMAQFLLGIEMVMQRSSGGNTAYFLGKVSAGGWKHYFPVLYILKEPLALHILTLTALLFATWRVFKGNKSLRTLKEWIHENFFEFVSLFFIAFYWLYSIQSPLNIGIRHVLPTFPFIYFLVSKEIFRWLSLQKNASPETWFEWLITIYKKYIASIPKYIFISTMLLWLVFDTVFAFPNYLSYFNELAGSWSSKKITLNIKTAIANGHEIAVDSNYDWGQDLKRLAKYAEDHRIKKIALDYFGGGSPRYYLGDKFEPWWSAKGQSHGYFAISATFLQGAHGKPANGFIRNPQDSYEWLRPFRPIDRAGESIFIYKLP